MGREKLGMMLQVVLVLVLVQERLVVLVQEQLVVLVLVQEQIVVLMVVQEQPVEVQEQLVVVPVCLETVEVPRIDADVERLPRLCATRNWTF